MKTDISEYATFYKAIKPAEVMSGFIGHGLFSGRLIPMFSSESFFTYMKRRNRVRWEEQYRSFCLPSTFECPRADGSSRLISMPDPLAYWKEAQVIKEFWPNLVAYFHQKTKESKVNHSLIHIEKDGDFLFSMSPKSLEGYWNNYSLLARAEYVAYADISSFFPSIYTHAIEWALKGKPNAKKRIATRRRATRKNFGSKLDDACRYLTDNETIGVPIGPHTSNLFGEIILCDVDEKLERAGYHNFIRYIDDYYYYADSKQDAQRFIASLSSILADYNLAINQRKSAIRPTPIPFVEPWLSATLTLESSLGNGGISTKTLGAYFDEMNLLTTKFQNASVIKHALKYVSQKTEHMDAASVEMYKAECAILLFQHSYVATFLEDVLSPLIEQNSIWLGPFLHDVTERSISSKNKIVLSYAVYLAIKYSVAKNIAGFLKDIFSLAKQFDDPTLLLLSYLLNKEISGSLTASIYRNAKSKKPKPGAKNKFWIYYYEVLTEADLDQYFKQLKREGISFVNFRNIAPKETEYRETAEIEKLSKLQRCLHNAS